jgi:hypothetical protein
MILIISQYYFTFSTVLNIISFILQSGCVFQFKFNFSTTSKCYFSSTAFSFCKLLVKLKFFLAPNHPEGSSIGVNESSSRHSLCSIILNFYCQHQRYSCKPINYDIQSNIFSFFPKYSRRRHR